MWRKVANGPNCLASSASILWPHVQLHVSQYSRFLRTPPMDSGIICSVRSCAVLQHRWHVPIIAVIVCFSEQGVSWRRYRWRNDPRQGLLQNILTISTIMPLNMVASVACMKRTALRGLDPEAHSTNESGKATCVTCTLTDQSSLETKFCHGAACACQGSARHP